MIFKYFHCIFRNTCLLIFLFIHKLKDTVKTAVATLYDQISYFKPKNDYFQLKCWKHDFKFSVHFLQYSWVRLCKLFPNPQIRICCWNRHNNIILCNVSYFKLKINILSSKVDKHDLKTFSVNLSQYLCVCLCKPCTNPQTKICC